jgi:Flp pilus assembly protein TadD
VYAKKFVELTDRAQRALADAPVDVANVRHAARQILVLGSRAAVSRPFLDLLARHEPDLIWRGDLGVVKGDWAGHIQRVFRYVGDDGQRVVANVLGAESARDIAEGAAYVPVVGAGGDDGAPAGWHLYRLSGDAAFKAANRLYQAERAFDDGDVALAISHARRATELEPTNADGHFRLGAYLGQAGSFEEGVNECQIAAALRPGWALPRVEVGIILLEAGRAIEALAQLEGVAAAPEHRSPHLTYHLAVALHRTNRSADALRLLDQVLADTPGHAHALDLAATCAFSIGDDVRGRRLMKDAAELGQRSTYLQWEAGTFRKRKA